MNTVDESLNHLIEAVRNSKEFQDYQIVKAKVEKYPEKREVLTSIVRGCIRYRTIMVRPIYIIILMRSRGIGTIPTGCADR